MARHQDGQATASFWLAGLAEHQGLRAGEHLGTGCAAVHAGELNQSPGKDRQHAHSSGGEPCDDWRDRIYVAAQAPVGDPKLFVPPQQVVYALVDIAAQ